MAVCYHVVVSELREKAATNTMAEEAAGQEKKAKMNLALLCIQFIVTVWDFLTYPFYQFIYQPWSAREADKRIR